MGKYTISISGYGCELTIGSVSEEEKEILSNADKELIEIVTEDFDYGPEEIDDQFHCFGCTEPYTVTVEDEGGCELYQITDEDPGRYDTDDFELFETVFPKIDESKDLLACWHGEKGEFFRGYVEAEEFDIQKLKIEMSEVEIGDDFYFGYIISKVSYDGEEIDNWGGDTTGKSFDAWKSF